MKRRSFIQAGALATAFAGVTLPVEAALRGSLKPKFPTIKFGACADIHQDFYPGVPDRLSEFVDDMTDKNADFIIQLGDFCRPEPENQIIMDIFNRFPHTKLHVLGNHDSEKRFPREEVVKFWGAIGKYYSLNLNDYHIVVLDGNETNPNPSRNCALSYERYISDEQLQWLEEDINSTSLYTLVFSHQSLDLDSGVENSAKVRAVLDRCNQRTGFQKILMVISGHHHLDYHNVINGINYIQVNSMCYHWQGDQFAESPFSKEINDKYPLLPKMSHYKDSLYAFFEISETGVLKMKGKKSDFLGKSPQELGMPEFHHTYRVVPYISDREIQLPTV